jgi:hypothetical protein
MILNDIIHDVIVHAEAILFLRTKKIHQHPTRINCVSNCHHHHHHHQCLYSLCKDIGRLTGGFVIYLDTRGRIPLDE